jgi:hypothetical protein
MLPRLARALKIAHPLLAVLDRALLPRRVDQNPLTREKGEYRVLAVVL